MYKDKKIILEFFENRFITALGQAVNLASCLAKFPQAALNHDRNAVYSATFNKTTFDRACTNEIMTISKEVLDEMSKGVEQFNKGVKQIREHFFI